jgi:hypothetical protein
MEVNNKKRIGVSAALLIGAAVVVSPAAIADAALDRAMDRAVEHYKRSQAGGGAMAAKPGKGDAMKGGAMKGAMKAGAMGDAMKAGAMGDAMKK